MQIDATEARGGALWFARAGLIAIVLSLALYFTDEMLSNSKREAQLGHTLRELRGAQTSLGSPETVDPRQSGALPQQ